MQCKRPLLSAYKITIETFLVGSSATIELFQVENTATIETL